MATISTLVSATGSGLPASTVMARFPLLYVENMIDLASAATAKGSALATGDVIKAIYLPVNTIVLTAGFEVITANAGSTVMTMDLGVTAVDPDAFVAAFDFVAAVVGDFAVKPLGGSEAVTGNTASSLDLLIKSLTTTNTAGKVRIFAYLLDIADQKAPGIAQLKS